MAPSGVLLFGLLFFIPLLGMAVRRWALAGSMTDVGIDDEFIRRRRGVVTDSPHPAGPAAPGRSESASAQTPRPQALAIRRYPIRVLRNGIYRLNPEGVDALRAWLDGVWADALTGFQKLADATDPSVPDPEQEHP